MYGAAAAVVVGSHEGVKSKDQYPAGMKKSGYLTMSSACLARDPFLPLRWQA